MDHASELSESEQRRQEWLSRLRDEFVKLEPRLAVWNFLPDDGLPAWVQNIEREIAAAMFPVVKVKKVTKLTPQGLGAMIGHTCAYGVWMVEALETLPNEIQDKDLTSKFTSEQFARGEEFLLSLNDWYLALRRLAKRALCSAVDQSYADMTEFLLGYSQAFSRKPQTRGTSEIGNSATEIYFRMITRWRSVNAMNSVHELHQWLVKYFGPHRVGDLKRIEKICQRIQLHYRRPGRPKRLK
jgi:hypothetical protein